VRLEPGHVGVVRRAWRGLPEADKAVVVAGAVFTTPVVLAALDLVLRAR
jgi:hypothetical protein